MRLETLLDANLSWRLIKKLTPFFEQVIHANDLKINQPAKDVALWNFARDNDFTVVTKDDDFEKLVLLRKAPPKVIYLKTFNLETDKLSELLISNNEKIHAFKNSEEDEILEIYSS